LFRVDSLPLLARSRPTRCAVSGSATGPKADIPLSRLFPYFSLQLSTVRADTSCRLGRFNRRASLVARTGHRSPGALISLQIYQGLGAAGVTMPPWTRQRVPTSVAVVSTTSKSWVIVAVLAIIADAEQYFSTDSAMARSTFSGATPRPFTTKCM